MIVAQRGELACEYELRRQTLQWMRSRPAAGNACAIIQAVCAKTSMLVVVAVRRFSSECRAYPKYGSLNLQAFDVTADLQLLCRTVPCEPAPRSPVNLLG